MRIGSLFAGIGGLELGLEWAGVGHTVWQVERDAYCRTVLERHWPEAQRFDDVRTVGGATLPPVDLICGGFPCQDVSSAGARKGLAGSRSGLWFEYLRIVGELRPQWVVVENVASGANAWVDAVVSGLEKLGYAAFSFPISAADCGAPHLRKRVFIVACDRDRDRESTVPINGEVAKLRSVAADSVSPELREQQGRGSGARWAGAPEPGDDGTTTSDPNGARCEGRGNSGKRGATGARANAAPDGREVWAGRIAPEPAIRRVDDGLPRGVARRRLKALGNAVVPQCAEVVGWIIRELI